MAWSLRGICIGCEVSALVLGELLQEVSLLAIAISEMQFHARGYTCILKNMYVRNGKSDILY